MPALADPFLAETLPHLAELRRAARKFARGLVCADEDLVQETYLRAIAARTRYRPGTNARAWLYTILAHAASTARRRARAEARLHSRLATEPPLGGREIGDGPPPQLGQALHAALAALPPPQRAVVELADLQDLSYAEVAARLGLPIGTVMSRLHRARRKLRRALGEGESA